MARAKINLYLHITGRRADGFHLLDSLIAFTELGDRLTAEPSESLSLELTGPFAESLGETAPADNLVLRAAGLLAEWARAHGAEVRGARLRLEKILPIASGIGGGSADAAAALHLLCALWRLDVPPAELARIGLSLGSDIPACIAGTSARMSGIGEALSPVPALPPVPIVLVNPLIALPTPQVYKLFAAKGVIADGPRPSPQGPFGDVKALVTGLASTANDLEAAAVELCPAIGRGLAALEREGAYLARMSGSGATTFGLFETEEAAARAAGRIRTTPPGYWAEATRFAESPETPA